MEDIIMQCANSGIEVVALYYLIKTLPAINDLSRGIEKLTDKLNQLEQRIGNIELNIQRRNL